jgi:hypothetical protein
MMSLFIIIVRPQTWGLYRPIGTNQSSSKGRIGNVKVAFVGVASIHLDRVDFKVKGLGLRIHFKIPFKVWITATSICANISVKSQLVSPGMKCTWEIFETPRKPWTIFHNFPIHAMHLTPTIVYIHVLIARISIASSYELIDLRQVQGLGDANVGILRAVGLTSKSFPGKPSHGRSQG